MVNNESKPHASMPLNPRPPIEESTFVEEQPTVQSSAVSQPATPDAPRAQPSTMDASGNPPRYEETTKAPHKTNKAKVEQFNHFFRAHSALTRNGISWIRESAILSFPIPCRYRKTGIGILLLPSIRSLVGQGLVQRTYQGRYQDEMDCPTNCLGNLPWSRLTPLHRTYWESRRRRWALEDGIHSMSAARGFARQRKHPDWYLSEELREDCAGRGGCCGRSCGCCEKPRLVHGFNPDQIWIPNQIQGKGHCTSACHCCLKAYCIQGNSISGETFYNEKIQDLDEVRFVSVGSWDMDHHSKRLIKGYLFRWPGME
ncbi:hypothetical protein N7499_007071 [Penicillium canescens]|nr:hypothetical protein N7522_008270 [Penicillium canescens]KAJ6082197.1 hypothetical protein N7499_007071 [Penicillium canescens]KAJ6176007.1 hypothetical protein N7485_002921 [Penicillium canescens]